MRRSEQLSNHEEAYLAWFETAWGNQAVLTAAFQHAVASVGYPRASQLLVKAGARKVKVPA